MTSNPSCATVPETPSCLHSHCSVCSQLMISNMCSQKSIKSSVLAHGKYTLSAAVSLRWEDISGSDRNWRQFHLYAQLGIAGKQTSQVQKIQLCGEIHAAASISELTRQLLTLLAFQTGDRVELCLPTPQIMTVSGCVLMTDMTYSDSSPSTNKA